MKYKLLLSATVFCLLDLSLKVLAENCRGYGHSCPYPQRCCSNTCCIPTDYDGYHAYQWRLWNMWYFWFIIIFILMSCFGGCGYWRRRQLLLAHQRSLMTHPSPSPCNFPARQTRLRPTFPSQLYPAFRETFRPTTTSANTTPVMFPSPPPYTEVVSKPYNYPLSKADLPPYPGPPVSAGNTNDHYPSGPVHPPTYATVLPPLPAYSPAEQPNQNTATANNNREDRVTSDGTRNATGQSNNTDASHSARQINDTNTT